jgi:sugar lactone lactonase YvrE
MDKSGRLFIVDTAFRLVHVMDSKAMTYTTIGQGDQPVFSKPIAITGDDDGNVYITDSAGGVVYRYSLRDTKLTPFTRALERPTGIAFNHNNRLLYVTDTTDNRVVVLDLNGRERFRIGKFGDAPGQFNHPTDLFIDKSGILYVTDPLNSRIQLFSPEGTFLRAFGRAGDAVGDFSKPKGVAVDGEGNIYVCDALFDAVEVFDKSGKFQLVLGNRGSSEGEFWMPSGIYIDDDDTIYVADTYNRRVQVFRHVRSGAPQGEKR